MAETKDRNPISALLQHERVRVPVMYLSFMIRHFIHDNVLMSAGSLAFQTLLSLVPLMAVSLAILKVFPVFASLKQTTADFLFQNFAPAQGALMKTYLWEFIDKTSSLSMIGGIFLVVIALFLISTIDRTLNGIWEVQAPRKALQGFTLYWTVLTLGPLLIGTSVVASSYVWYSVFADGELLGGKLKILSYLPVFNSAIALFLLYMLVPNRKVRFRHALAGGVLAAVLFELAKRWFTFYVANFATFEHIYGAVSVVPMLFFWIYLEWVVVLTGAEFVFSLDYFNPKEQAEPQEFDPLQGVPEVIAVLRAVWRAQTSGSFLTGKKLLSSEIIADRSKLGLIVEFLEQNHMLHQTADGGLAVNADLNSMTLYELYSRMPVELFGSEPGRGSELSGGEPFDRMRAGVREALERTMQKPLIELVNEHHENVS